VERRKINSAQSSPHKNGLKSTKNQGYGKGLNIGLNPSSINETRPYSAKNSGYNRPKSYGSKSKRSEMKRSNSKKSPGNVTKDFANSFYNKFAHPGGIGLYGPGKIKISKDKQNISSRGSAPINKSSNNPNGGKAGKQKGVSFENLNFHISFEISYVLIEKQLCRKQKQKTA